MIYFLNFGEDVWGWSGPGYYFYDESGANAVGPWKSEEEAEQMLQKYCKECL